MASCHSPKVLIACVLAALVPAAQALDAEQQALREVYEALINTNTTASSGDCTVAATAMRERLRAAGYPDADMHIVVSPGGPTKGNLVARLKGSGAKRPLLLLAHLDVVEARREDWTRDPFRMLEENGVFYGRGTIDDKAMAAAFVRAMIRYRQEGLKPQRDLILALTCEEEIVPSEFDGVDHLLKHHRGLIDAELALNEGAGGILDKNERPMSNRIGIGEKVYQSFQLEVTNAGGHSAWPTRDNAIYQLAEALARLGRFEFPIRLLPSVRRYFELTAPTETPETAADIRAILAEPPDSAAMVRLHLKSTTYNAIARTTCAATLLNAGHAANALPQRAQATVNCRLLPDDSVADVQRTLVRVLADERIKLTLIGEAVPSPSPPLDPVLMKAIEDTTAELWPGVPVIPTLLVGATDGRFLNNAGIRTYATTGLFYGQEPTGVHGLNEHVRVKSLYDGAEYLYRLAKRLAQ